jgi:hypothetical protein
MRPHLSISSPSTSGDHYLNSVLVITSPCSFTIYVCVSVDFLVLFAFEL